MNRLRVFSLQWHESPNECVSSLNTGDSLVSELVSRRKMCDSWWGVTFLSSKKTRRLEKPKKLFRSIILKGNNISSQLFFSYILSCCFFLLEVMYVPQTRLTFSILLDHHREESLYVSLLLPKLIWEIHPQESLFLQGRHLLSSSSSSAVSSLH
jgi:hypothetical protein